MILNPCKVFLMREHEYLHRSYLYFIFLQKFIKEWNFSSNKSLSLKVSKIPKTILWIYFQSVANWHESLVLLKENFLVSNMVGLKVVRICCEFYILDAVSRLVLLLAPTFNRSCGMCGLHKKSCYNK